MKKNSLIILVLLLLTFSMQITSQTRDSKVHRRSILQQTVYNTGELGRAWMTGTEGNETSLPLMEWPSYSAVVLGGKTYSGQHNSLGAGVHIAANEDSLPGQANRLFALCGAVGSTTPEVSFGRWSFPYDFVSRKENYPILADGSLNPAYNPNEAEEIITASWGTNIGIMVNRTSRAWSYPDYDDFIIYEYEFIYNGDTDGNPKTIERTKTLKDVDFAFVYGFGPSMYGYQRHYDVWKYTGGLYKGDQDMFFDAEYWLTFNMDRATNQDSTMAGKPEPDSTLFGRFARTGENGGGLASPQAPGFCVMYFDTTHLARVYGGDTVLNESEYGKYYQPHMLYSFDSHKLKQPWTNRIQTGDINSIKQTSGELTATVRSVTPYSSTATPVPANVNRPPYETQAKRDAYKAYWAGRAPHQISNTTFGVRKNINFAPYTMRFGDTIRFTIAEVVGYGADPFKPVEGGRDTTGRGATNIRWNSAPHWYKKVYSYVGGQKVKMTDNYLEEFGYPDYVNSAVRNVMQVSHKAYEAYTGLDSVTLKTKLPIHPEEMPAKGSYANMLMPCPAPGILVTNTDTGTVVLTWKRDAELFTSPRLTGTLKSYNIYRSISGMGPWTLIGNIPVGTAIDSSGKYRFTDADATFKIGTQAFYAVTSVDDKGNQSGKTNMIKFQKNLGSVAKLGKVYAVPNPFIGRSGFVGTGEVDDKIGFYGLPAKCTIRIFSFAGNLVETIEHDAPLYTVDYFQTTKNGQEVASGIYFYVVTTPSGESFTGKFVIIK